MPYHLLTSNSDLDSLSKTLSGVKRLAVDTETEGFRVEQGQRIIGVSLSLGPTREDEHFYIPVRHENYTNADLDATRNVLSPVFKSPDIEKLAHNLKFDGKFLSVDGMAFDGPLQDTIVMAHLLQHDNYADKIALKKLGVSVLKEPAEDQKALYMHILEKFPNTPEKKLMSKMKWTDPNVCCQYACTDTRLTFALFLHFMEILNSSPALMENYLAEIAITRGLINLELRGVPIDKEWLRDSALKTEHELDDLLKELRKEAGALFNPQSGPQVYWYLFEHLKLPLPPAERTKTGKVSLGKDTLGAVDHPAAKKIEDYRQKHTLLATYYLGLQAWITSKKDMPGAVSDGCVHPNLHQVGTPHARFSCKEPNLQNQPKDVRPAFLVRPGYESWRWDYSQVEMRVFAHYSGDKILIDGYNNDAAFDIHAAIGKELGVPRKNAKTVNFLIIYGGGAAKLAANLGISEVDAKRFLTKYYNRFPGVKRLRAQASNVIKRRVERNGTGEVVKWGYVEDVFGRRYYLPPDKAYMAVNRLVAGCAANLMKHGMAKVFGIFDDMRAEHGPDAGALLMNIHDELEAEIRKDVPAREIWVPKITNAMVDFPFFKLPILADCQVTDTRWSEAKPHQVSG